MPISVFIDRLKQNGFKFSVAGVNVAFGGDHYKDLLFVIKRVEPCIYLLRSSNRFIYCAILALSFILANA